MSEPTTNGRVQLQTSLGPLDIELWSRESPIACRNFVGLCLEGYYDGTIFHRMSKDFVLQGGDREHGDGSGGASIFSSKGEFPVELNQRLRFATRGLLATAAGPTGNSSQFFITLALNAPLERSKHTIFGSVVGPSLYNLVKANECVVDKDDRPLFPPTLQRAEVLENPFLDLAPRAGVEWGNKKREGEEESKKKRPTQRRKNLGTLSFGEAGEEELLGAEEGGLMVKMSSSVPESTRREQPKQHQQTEKREKEEDDKKAAGESDTKRVRLERADNEEDEAMVVELTTSERMIPDEEEEEKKKKKSKKEKKKKKETKEKKPKKEKGPKDTSVKKLSLKKSSAAPADEGPDRAKEVARFNEKKLLLLSKSVTKQKQEETAQKFKKFRADMAKK